MKRLMACLCVAGLVACTGCNSSPTGGRTETNTTNPNRPSSSTKETFKLKAPEMATKVEQGTSKTFKISISRGADFKDDVTLKAESSDPKLHADLEPKAFKGSENKDVEVTVKADPEAKLGKQTITITGTPAAGEPTSVAAEVDVTAK